MREQWETEWKDYYKLLGLDVDAEPEVIQGAFRALARKYHPDKDGSADADHMRVLLEAAEVLRDPDRRRAYDTEYRLRREHAEAQSGEGEYGELADEDEEEDAEQEEIRGEDRAARASAEYAAAMEAERVAVQALEPIDYLHVEERKSFRLSGERFNIHVEAGLARVGHQVMRFADVTAIRYGPPKVTESGKRYIAWLSNGRGEMKIVFKDREIYGFDMPPGRWFDASGQKHWEKLLKFLWHGVQIPLLGRWASQFAQGAAICIGPLSVHRSGLSLAGLLGHRSLAWDTAGGYGFSGEVVSGWKGDVRNAIKDFALGMTMGLITPFLTEKGKEVQLYDSRGRVWASIPLSDTWNAVCLPPFLEALGVPYLGQR